MNDNDILLERMRKRIVHLVHDFNALYEKVHGDGLLPLHLTQEDATQNPATEAATVAVSATVAEKKASERNGEERKCPKKEEGKKANQRKEKKERYMREALSETDMEERRRLFTANVNAATPDWPDDKRQRFIAYWSQPSAYKPGTMLCELRGWDLQSKLSTWVDYTRSSALAMARTRQAEEAHRRSVQAEEERERRSRERDERYRQQQQAVVPLPVLFAFRDAGLGDPFQMDKAAIIHALRTHLATHNAPPLSPTLTQWLATT